MGPVCACVAGLPRPCWRRARSRPPSLDAADFLPSQNEEDAFRKIKLRVEDVQGRFCLTNFHGMDLTTDKLRSLIKKRCDIIEANW